MKAIIVNKVENGKNIVTHSNQLSEARYTLTIAEQRLVLTLLSMISPDDNDFKNYEIKISDFKELLQINTNAVYDQTKEVLRKLASRVIYIPDGKNYFISHWFSSAKYSSETGTVYISLDNLLKPYLLQLKSQFTKYQLFRVAQFQGFYTIRIYTLLKQYESIGCRDIPLIELRSILDISDEKYRLFKEFKRNVLMRAKKEFETIDKETGTYKSDITFDLETFRTGRKITDLKFIIKRQKVKTNQKIEIEDSLVTPHPKELTPPPKPKVNKPTRQPSLSPAVKALSRYNISERRAKNYEADQGEEAILSCIKLYEDRISQGQVQNKSGGYLISMLEAKAGMISQAQMEAEKKKEEETRLKIKAEQEKRLEDYKHTLIVKFERGIRKQYLGSLTPLEKETLWEEIKPLFENVSQYLIQEGKELESPVVGIELSKRIPNYEERKDNYINLKMAEKRQELFGNIDDF